MSFDFNKIYNWYERVDFKDIDERQNPLETNLFSDLINSYYDVLKTTYEFFEITKEKYFLKRSYELYLKFIPFVDSIFWNYDFNINFFELLEKGQLKKQDQTTITNLFGLSKKILSNKKLIEDIEKDYKIKKSKRYLENHLILHDDYYGNKNIFLKIIKKKILK